MQKFVHEAAGERFDSGLLRRSERLQARLGAAKFGLAHVFGGGLQIDQRGHDVERFDAALVTDKLLFEDGLGALRLASSIGEIGCGDAIEDRRCRREICRRGG